MAEKGKALLKSASTVLTRGKPVREKSIAAKRHIGKGLFCTKKPPKTEQQNNETTHHQRAHVKLMKSDMAEAEGNKYGELSMIVSMDDKAYLRPGTDVGAKGSRKQRIYTSTEQPCSLPQHDFSNSKLHTTPSSFRYMKKKLIPIESENGELKDHLMNVEDQSVVMVRPKYYVGSSGSVWASDQMDLRWKHPELYEIENNNDQSLKFRQFIAQIHDRVKYFIITTMHLDILKVTLSAHCEHKVYEKERLGALKVCFTKAKEMGQHTWGNPEKECVEEIISTINSIEKKITDVENALQDTIGRQLVQKYDDIVEYCKTLIVKLPQTPVKPVVLELTDKGPGVGVNSLETQIREAEMALIHDSLRRTRVHRARDDSGQGESERTNASIGEALCGGQALKWNYYVPLEGKTKEEKEAMTIEEIEQEEEICEEKNAWRIAQDVRDRIHMEPGPAGDVMFAHVTEKPDKQFFHNKIHLEKYNKAAKSKQKDMPGGHYFSYITDYKNTHMAVGDLYLEYLAGKCSLKGTCDPCKNSSWSHINIKPGPRPIPNYALLPNYHYKPHNLTPLEGREIDDYQPRVQLRKLHSQGKISIDDETQISSFCDKYIVAPTHVQSYISHLDSLDLKKRKRKEKKQAEKKGSRQNTDSELDTESTSGSSSDSDSKSGSESDSEGEEDRVLAVISSSSASDSDSNSPTQIPQFSSRGRRVTTYKSRVFFGDN